MSANKLAMKHTCRQIICNISSCLWRSLGRTSQANTHCKCAIYPDASVECHYLVQTSQTR